MRYLKSFLLIFILFVSIQNLLSLDSLEKISFDLAQKQLNAYNEKNLDEFLKSYSSDVEVYIFPDSLLYRGIEKMEIIYKNFFERSPRVQCRLLNRIVNGKYVIDSEYITNHYSGKDFEAVAIYEISKGLIRKVWFIPRKETYSD